MLAIAAVLRNRLGTLLIVLQLCLTLAIVANAAVVVQQQLRRMAVPSGIDEGAVFSFLNRWVGQPDDYAARVARDLDLIRGMPGVVDAVSINGVPLSGRGWGTRLDRSPYDPARSDVNARPRGTLYFLDEHGAPALGLELLSGRWFTAEDMPSANAPPRVAMLTQSLARTLFPEGGALGGQVYQFSREPLTVVGIVREMVGPDAGTDGGADPGAVVLLPQRFAQRAINNYVVRTRPGELASVMATISQKLSAADPMRATWQLLTFEETRAESFRRARALSIVLVAVSALLLAVTAFGIVGLTTYWVAQRRRAIGVFRALGARRADVLRQVQTESLLVAGTGVLIGSVLTVLLNLWLSSRFGVPRLDLPLVFAGAALVLLLAQFAALWPALRAAATPPALVTRSG